MSEKRSAFLRGCKNGIPIAAGYFAVAFSLGISMKRAGIAAPQGFLLSFLNHASAGEYAAISAIGASASLLETVLVTCIADARYLLMSFSFSQKFSPQTSLKDRLLCGFGITDELFALAIAQPSYLEPMYFYGAFLTAALCWATGSVCGIIGGTLLPERIVQALSVALYAMFLAIIIPQGREDKVVAGLILLAFVSSGLLAQFLPQLSEGTRVIVLTLVLCALAAHFFPRKEEGR